MARRVPLGMAICGSCNNQPQQHFKITIYNWIQGFKMSTSNLTANSTIWVCLYSKVVWKIVFNSLNQWKHSHIHLHSTIYKVNLYLVWHYINIHHMVAQDLQQGLLKCWLQPEYQWRRGKRWQTQRRTFLLGSLDPCSPTLLKLTEKRSKANCDTAV